MNICAIETIGTAISIHKIQNRLAQIAIANNTANGDNLTALLIMMGTKTLFSVSCMITYRIIMIMTACNQRFHAIAIAGKRAKNGHAYGMNSINPAISQSVRVSEKLILTQNNLTMFNQIVVNKKIDKHSINCHFSQ